LRRSHSHRAKFILYLGGGRSSIVSQIPAMTPDLFLEKENGESNMLNKLLGAAAMAAVVCAVVPASAAGGGCSSANLTKTEAAVDAMADGENRMAAQKEIAMAQEAMLAGKMGVCGMHLNKAMHTSMMK
jgi:hypothetical protein